MAETYRQLRMYARFFVERNRNFAESPGDLVPQTAEFEPACGMKSQKMLRALVAPDPDGRKSLHSRKTAGGKTRSGADRAQARTGASLGRLSSSHERSSPHRQAAHSLTGRRSPAPTLFERLNAVTPGDNAKNNNEMPGRQTGQACTMSWSPDWARKPGRGMTKRKGRETRSAATLNNATPSGRFVSRQALTSRKWASGEQAAHQRGFGDAIYGKNHGAGAWRNVMLAHGFHHFMEAAHDDFLQAQIHFV